MEHSHAKTVEEVSAFFAVAEETGLTDDQIQKNREKYGPNGKSFHYTIKLSPVCSFTCLTTTLSFDVHIFEGEPNS